MSAIKGMMLSVGHISLISITGNARFIFVQSGKKTKREYFDLILTIMKPFLTVGYIPYIKEWYDIKQDTVYSSISLTTMQLPCFTQLRILWYVNGIKIIPKNIQELLTPIADSFCTS